MNRHKTQFFDTLYIAMTEWPWQELHKHDLPWLSQNIIKHSTRYDRRQSFKNTWPEMVYDTKSIQGKFMLELLKFDCSCPC